MPNPKSAIFQTIGYKSARVAGQGATGPTGPAGAAGQGVATGGAAGQYLRKQSVTNYDTTWATIPISEVSGLQTALDAKQPLDADLTTIAGLTPSANQFLFYSGGWTAHSLVAGDIPALAISGITGLQIALDAKQALNANLTAISAITFADNDFLQRISGTLTNRTPAQVKASLAIATGDVSGLGTIATQNANAVDITGGTINGTTLGATTPAAGTFTTVTIQSASDPSVSFRPSGASANNFLRIYNNVGNERARFSYDTNTAVLSIAVGATLTTPLMTLSAGTSSMGLGGVTIFGSSSNKLIINPYVTADTLANLMINAGSTLDKPLVVQSASSQTANLTEWQNSAGLLLDFIAASGAATFGRLDSGTSDTQNVLTIRRGSSNTPAADFAERLLFQTHTNPTSSGYRDAASWRVRLNTAADATRAWDMIGSVFYTTTEQEFIRAIAASGGVQLAFFGATGSARTAAYTQTYATATRTLSAYTSDPENSAYTGIDNAQAGTPYAKLTDLNALRVAYENLRVFVENAVQVLNQTIDDHQAYGLFQ